VGSGGSVQCERSDLSPGERGRIDVTVGVAATKGTKLHDAASVTSSAFDPKPGNDTGTVTTRVT